jgi:YVTN family beta-propeller protein
VRTVCILKQLQSYAAGRLTLTALGVWFFTARAAGADAGGYAYITNQLENSVSVIDTGAQQVAHTIPVTGKPAGVAVNPVLPLIYVSTPEAGGFVVLDGKNFKALKFVKAGGAPLGIAVDRLGEQVFVADWYQNTVSIFDARDFRALATL